MPQSNEDTISSEGEWESEESSEAESTEILEVDISGMDELFEETDTPA